MANYKYTIWCNSCEYKKEIDLEDYFHKDNLEKFDAEQIDAICQDLAREFAFKNISYGYKKNV